MIVQNISAAATGLTDISFTLPRDDGQIAMRALARIRDEVGYDKLLYDDRIGKVSLIGAGMRSHPGITARFFAALASAGVNIEMISTSEIRISVIVDEGQVDAAVQSTHTAFDLDSDRGRGRRLRRDRTMSSIEASRPAVRLGVVGATGQVGVVMREILAERDFPVERDPVLRLRPLGRHGAAVAGRRGRRRGRRRRRPGRARHRDVLRGRDDLARPGAGLRRGRRDRGRQLLGLAAATPTCRWSSPRSTPRSIADARKGIIANPNCTTMAAMPVLKPLHDEAGLVRLVASTYQAVSGCGRRRRRGARHAGRGSR